MTKPEGWRGWAQGEEDVSARGDRLTVMLDDGRSHRVLVREGADTVELESVVVRGSRLAELPDPGEVIWTKNRFAKRVGFRVDSRERLVAFTWLPTAGLSKGEFLSELRHLAQAADLLEFQLTGGDRE